MLAQTLRTAARQTSLLSRRTYASVGGSSPHPIRESGKELAQDAKNNSNLIVFGGLAAVGAGGLYWMMQEKSHDPLKPPVTQNLKGDEQNVTKTH
ncbi:hypothetical protein JCM8097_005057 [Rhodosporidiobolus ruineniae]